MLSAQALPTATGPGYLKIGGGFAADFPDYTRHKFYGYGFYGTYDFTQHLGVEGEFHYTRDTIVPQYQRTFAVGGRYYRTYGRFMPYGKALFGFATMEFPPLPTQPLTVAAGTATDHYVAYGAGVDIPLTWHIIARADLEYQHWFVTSNGAAYNNIGGLPRGLTPILYTGGVAWRFGSSDPKPRGRMPY